MRFSKRIYCFDEIPIGKDFVPDWKKQEVYKKISKEVVFSFYTGRKTTLKEYYQYEKMRRDKCLLLVLPEKKIESRFELLDIRK